MAVSNLEFNDLKSQLDQFWMLVGGILVFFMQAGFAMLEAGSSKARD